MAVQQILEAKNFEKIGIETGEIKLNLDKMMKNKDKAVTVLTKGVEFLFKKNKVTYFKGKGSFENENSIKIEGLEPYLFPNSQIK